MFFLVILILVLCGSHPSSLTEAKRCSVSSEPRVWVHDNGQFRHIRGTNKWVEMNDKNEEIWTFEEEQKHGEQVIVHSKERELSILLQGDLAAIRPKGQQNFQQLYGGQWVKVADCT